METKALYQISNEYLHLINQVELAEGELTPELEQSLQINKNELEVKSIAYVEYIKSKESFNERINEEIKRLQTIKKSNENLIDKLKNNLVSAVNLYGSFKSGFLTFGIRKSKSVEIDGDVNDIPKEYKTIKVTETPDKLAIKKALESGDHIPNCYIVEKQNLAIK